MVHARSIDYIDAATHAEDLNKFLQERPAPEELVGKNILKGTHTCRASKLFPSHGCIILTATLLYMTIDTNVSPALQQHAEELKKAQLEDTLNSKLEHRPPASELIEHNILHG